MFIRLKLTLDLRISNFMLEIIRKYNLYLQTYKFKGITMHTYTE